MDSLDDVARLVAEQLALAGRQLVLAESCTAGLVAATLGGQPGISQHFCGSAVAYQEPTKTAWLGVPEKLFASPGAVSAEVAAAMAKGALEATPQSDIAVAVTGHLGPGAPPSLDGVIYVAVQVRGLSPQIARHQLLTSQSGHTQALRLLRQHAAASIVLRHLSDSLGRL